MNKAYEDGHETVYQKMKKQGIRSWGERKSVPANYRREIDRRARTFLTEVLRQPWVPKQGEVIELGCGTAPILRWVCKRGFRGLGVDVSKTAITMAQAQSHGLDVRFRRADLCASRFGEAGTFDLAIDGRCLHCITEPKDRRRFLVNVRRLLKRNGIFIILTMAAPLNRGLFTRMHPELKLVGHTLYVPVSRAREYEGWRRIGGQDCVASRYIGHWQRILTEVRRAGFGLQLIKYEAPSGQDAGADLSVAAVAAR